MQPLGIVSSFKEVKDMRKFSILLLALIALLVVGCSSTAVTPTPTPALTPVHTPTPTPTPTEGKTIQWPNPPPMTIDQNKQYVATIKTNYGDIVVQLFPQDAPLAVNNFVFLARQGFYDGVKFHRVVKGFVIQSGDPTGTGSGGPGYKFADENVTRDYITGTLAMANSGPNTNGSQFFITLVDLSGQLPKKYTIFGLVSSGFDVVQKIGNVPVKANPRTSELSVPTVDVYINSISIEEE
jgi:cyclophilin family peptidyl-prolyl cis-trans isomerase